MRKGQRCINAKSSKERRRTIEILRHLPSRKVPQIPSVPLPSWASDELTRRAAKKEDVPSKSFVISPLGKYPKSPPFLFPVGQRLNFLASSSNPRSNFGRNKSSSANGSSNSMISSHNVRFDAQSMCEAWTMSMPLDLMFSLVFP